LAAVVVLLFGGFLALSLNTGHMMNARAQLQGAYDAAALAGAHELDGTVAGVTDAKATAVAYGHLHRLDRVAVGLLASDVLPGHWDSVARAFYTTGDTVHIGDADVTLSPASTAQYYNAVKVTASTDGASGHNQPLAVWFSNFIGRTTVRVGASGIAVGGGPCTDSGCTLPLALPSCALVDAGGNVACGTTMTLHFNHGYGKDVALASLIPGFSASNFQERVQMHNGASCVNGTVEVGDDVRLGNGNDFNSQVESNMYFPTNIVCTGVPSPYTGCPRREVAVVNIGTNCSVPMNRTVEVVGFARIVILATDSSGADRSITVYLDCTGASSNASAGCANFGYGAKKLRLVQ